MSAAEDAASRTMNASRRNQGFRTQAHLDAFFRFYDHHRACGVCSSVAGHFELDDGMQPYERRCAEGRRLENESFGSA